MASEQNRAKVYRYRTRKALREMNMDENEIEQIIASVDWLVTSPSEVLSRLAPDTAYTLPQPITNHETTIDTSDMPVWVPVAAFCAICGVAIGVPLLVAKFAR